MPRALSEALAGAALGLLVGALLGMSTSPVVGTVLAALTALLATVLGLSADATPGNPQRWLPSASAVRITSFSILALVGALGGVYIRTHDALSPGLAMQAVEWQNIGFEKSVAKELVAYRVLGIVPADWTVAPKGDSDSKDDVKPDPRRSVLFSANANDCAQLRPDRFAAGELARSFAAAGGRWEALANAVKPMSDVQQKDALTAAWRIACEQP